MRATLLRRFAIISLTVSALLAAVPARTARRPHYGGTLRVEVVAAPSSLDTSPAELPREDSAIRMQIDSLLYESRNTDGAFTGDEGSGPFKISSWQPGKQLTLQANDKFRDGRPFVDAIEISMGRTFRDRLLDLELNKMDFTEIPAQEARHAAERGVRTSQSQPDELLAIVLLKPRAAATTGRVLDAIGQALSLSIDRTAIVTFLLQKVGEPSGALLPQWSSGTSFLFSTSPDVPRAKELMKQITASPKFVLGYDSADPLEQSIAERIAVNAKEAGISMTAIEGNAAVDARLVRVTMISPKPAAALNELLRTFNSLAANASSANPLRESASAAEIYQREREILEAHRIVPLVWLPQVYGLSARVRNWIPPLPGQTWPLADVWLDADDKSTDIKDR
jgi:MarR-like DNA-binding transcriptional regulator SgrR of sgrS sRNA